MENWIIGKFVFWCHKQVYYLFQPFAKTKIFQVRIGPPETMWKNSCVHAIKINQVTLKADDQAFRSAEVQSFLKNLHMVWTLVNLQYNWYVFFKICENWSIKSKACFIYFSQKFFCTMGHRNFCTESSAEISVPDSTENFCER